MLLVLVLRLLRNYCGVTFGGLCVVSLSWLEIGRIV